LIIIGLDISTSNIGICAIDSEAPLGKKLLGAIGLQLSKTKGLFAKAELFRSSLIEFVSKIGVEVDAIVIEESLQAFRRNMSSAGTIAKLNRFNGIVSYIARSEIGVPLYAANVVSSRKQIGLKLIKKSPVNTKDQVLKWVKEHAEMDSFDWPKKTLKSGPSKGEVRDEVFCYDIADAFVVAFWGAKNLKNDMLDANNA
jgi:hypothetical protein